MTNINPLYSITNRLRFIQEELVKQNTRISAVEALVLTVNNHEVNNRTFLTQISQKLDDLHRSLTEFSFEFPEGEFPEGAEEYYPGIEPLSDAVEEVIPREGESVQLSIKAPQPEAESEPADSVRVRERPSEDITLERVQKLRERAKVRVQKFREIVKQGGDKVSVPSYIHNETVHRGAGSNLSDNWSADSAVPSEEIDVILGLRAEGYHYTEIAGVLGWDVATIQRACWQYKDELAARAGHDLFDNEHSLQLSKRLSRFSDPEQLKELRTYINLGLSNTVIAKMFNCSKSTVSRLRHTRYIWEQKESESANG